MKMNIINLKEISLFFVKYDLVIDPSSGECIDYKAVDVEKGKDFVIFKMIYSFIWRIQLFLMILFTGIRYINTLK